MLHLLRARPLFRRLWLAGTLSLVGDWLSFVAVSLLVLDRGGGALTLAAVLAARALPQALFTPLAGVLADRFDRRKILLAAPLGQAALTLLMAAAAARGEVGLVQVLMVVRSAVTAFVAPTETAALRHTVASDELITANAVVSGTWSLAFVGGMALGGAIAVLGPAPAILLDAFTFVFAAALLHGLPAMRPEAGEQPRPAGVVGSVPVELWAAFRHALGEPELFRAMLAKAPVALAGGAGWVVLNLVAGQSAAFGSAALSLGILQAVRGAGTGLGPLAVARFAPGGRLAALAPHLSAGAGLVGVALFPFARSAPALLLLLAFVWGTGVGANWVLSSAALQRLAPDRYIGRLASLDELANTATTVLGAFVAALVLEVAPGAAVPAAALGALLGLGGWLWLSLRDGARRDNGGAAGAAVM